MRWKVLSVLGGLLALLLVGRLVAGSFNSSEAVDTTGASARRANSAADTPVRSASPAARATSSGPTPTTVVVQVAGPGVQVQSKPILLLNPSSVRPGSTIGVAGSGFDPGSTLDLFLKQREGDQADPATFVQADKGGNFGNVSLPLPAALPSGPFVVEARQRNSDKLASAAGVVAGGAPQVKLGTQVGKAGDVVQLSGEGFGANEEVAVYWNGVTGDPLAHLHSDGGGKIAEGSIQVPFGAVGNNGFIFVGATSQAPVTVPFLLLNLFPTVQLSSYALKPDTLLSFSGKDFGPGERVSVYLGSPDGPALAEVQADQSGAFAETGDLLIPFGLQGKQLLVFVGEQSGAPATAAFDLLPYTPNVQPSTYGGRPGTAITF
ncbi:MAG TPA: hypothetical protein VGC06_20165, partial [Actinomycetes bacterium]